MLQGNAPHTLQVKSLIARTSKIVMYNSRSRGSPVPLSRRVMIISLIFFSFLFISSCSSYNNERPERTRLKHLNTNKFKAAASLTDINQIMEDATKISVVRVPDTPSHAETQRYIISRISSDWEVEQITFTAETPFGPKKFTNIIAMLKDDKEYLKQDKLKNPPTSVVISAHYDSKYFKDFEFVASIDSAVSCALLIDLSHTMSEPLKKTVGKRPIPILVFFDGEEAFVDWNNKDSIYGSKHLAELWSNTKFYGEKTYLDSIETFVLLDLLGGPNPRLQSYFEDTTPLFDRLSAIHKKMKENSLALHQKDIFHGSRAYSINMQDDHIPFLQRGVNILHLITIPFPAVWHKEQDNMKAVDKNVISDLSIVFRIFFMEYLQSSI